MLNITQLKNTLSPFHRPGLGRLELPLSSPYLFPTHFGDFSHFVSPHFFLDLFFLQSSISKLMLLEAGPGEGVSFCLVFSHAACFLSFVLESYVTLSLT